MMTECKNSRGTRATQRAHLSRPVPVRRAKSSAGLTRAKWVRVQHVSRSGCVTNHAKLLIPGSRGNR